jgi:hypothetical protein
MQRTIQRTEEDADELAATVRRYHPELINVFKHYAAQSTGLKDKFAMHLNSWSMFLSDCDIADKCVRHSMPTMLLVTCLLFFSRQSTHCNLAALDTMFVGELSL